MHNPPENPPTCATPTSSLPSSDQYLVNLVVYALSVVQGWFSGRNRDHRDMSRRNKPDSQHLDRLLFGADLCASLSTPPLRAPDEIALSLVFQMCQHWGRNRLHTCLFVSPIICDEHCMCSIRGLNSGLLFSTIWRTPPGKGGGTIIFTVRLCEEQESSLPFYLWVLHENVSRVTMSWSHGLFMDFCLDHLQIPLDLAAGFVNAALFCSSRLWISHV